MLTFIRRWSAHIIHKAEMTSMPRFKLPRLVDECLQSCAGIGLLLAVKCHVQDRYVVLILAQAL